MTRKVLMAAALLGWAANAAAGQANPTPCRAAANQNDGAASWAPRYDFLYRPMAP